MDHPLIVMLREHAVVVMVVLFVGVLYWAFRGRMRARRRNGNKR
jgi:cbb3-type cytochrome oxidase subunit 3